ncbi:MerR family transcriptional regulator [Culicoidibacter larvae]|uniref:MerR family transcriptional regulator n=1 Tax=Culicoidibacter larvae TaxID=2579976 RepID=A0A5R8QBD7_9FIRM|nr:MerR family transcriptional regulator [Culicoidibacter larvae]TLG73891.1 MerR family transcriptional regulator [Culicoidibacter larvae]
MKTYNTKEAAALLNIPAHTLRYYDRIKLLSPGYYERSYRTYSQKEILLLRYIIVLRHIGCSIDEIQPILALYFKPITQECIDQLMSFITLQQNRVQSQIEQLSTISTLLTLASQNIGQENDAMDQLITKVCDDIQS